MNRNLATALSVVLMSTLALSAVFAPFGAIAQESQSSFAASTSDFGYTPSFAVPELDIPDGADVDSSDSGSAYSESSASASITCHLEANVYEINTGGNVTLEWETSGLSEVTINGASVTDTGKKTYTNILKDTFFKLSGTDGQGNECEQEVRIICLPDNEPKLCEPGDQYYDPENDLSGEIYAEGKGRVTNDSEYCNYKVGLASYEKFDEVIDNQRFFDDDTAVVHAESQRELMVNVPECAYQIDLFYGHVLTSLDGQRYGDRLLDADHVNGQNYCGDIVKPECPYLESDGYAPDGTLVVFADGTRLYDDRGDDQKRTRDYDVDLASGTYEVWLAAWDGYTNRINADQPREQYEVVIADEAGIVAVSNATTDLEDNVVSATFAGQVNSALVLERPASKVFARHAVTGDAPTPNSLEPICALFEKESDPEPETATVVAQKIVCEDESQLPNWGAGGPDITAETATTWVAQNDSCSFVTGWDFEWTDSQLANPGDALVGTAGSPWNTFGPTDSTGRVATTIDLAALDNQKLWFREVLQDGFIPFSHGANNQTNVDDVSAEFYCHTDVINYDNRDFISGLQDGETYYCVAWNAPVPAEPVPQCVDFTATPENIMVGATSTLSWETANATKVFINNGIGEVATTSGTYKVTPLDDLTYTLTVEGASGEPDTCSVPVTVSEDPLPVCKSFTATPDQLPFGGGEVTLEWETEQAVSVSIDQGIGAVELSGSTTTTLTKGLTYMLTATDDNGDTVTCPAPVTTPDPEPVFSCEDNVEFATSDRLIDEGDAATLTWSTTDVDTLTISNTNFTSLSGSETVSPRRDTTYVLTAIQGDESIECPVTVQVDEDGGGGGGGGISLRCDLESSSETISRGEEIELTWDTRGAREVSLFDDAGNIVFTTDDYLSDDKEEFFDHTVTVSPTRDTEYTLIAERGSRDRECTVEVEVEDDEDIVVLETRDQEPLVAGISLSQVPYTGFEAGPILTALFYTLLIAWSLFIAYLLVIRNRVVPSSGSTEVTENPSRGEEIMRIAMQTRPDAFPPTSAREGARASVEEAVVPSNLPTGNEAVATKDPVAEAFVNPHQVGDALVTELENRAHAQKALLSSDAVRHFIGTTEGSVERNEALDDVIAESKKTYPLEDGWVVINEARMRNLCVTCLENHTAHTESRASFVPSTVPEGTGSLAESIVTGNVVAAYELIGKRPMFSLADAAADLDAVVRSRKGESVELSDMLRRETQALSDAQLQQMIGALTGALDGTYTDEASAVKMAIMKAVKVAG